MGSTRWVTVGCFLAIELGVPAAYGQEECVKGDRETTAAERQTIKSTLETIKAALPQAPEGWIIGGYEEFSVRQRNCMDDETTPWPHYFNRLYNRVDDAAAREQALAEQAAVFAARTAERQPLIDAAIAKSQELAAQLSEAAQRGDQARVAAIQQEMVKMQEENERLFAPPTEEELNALVAATEQDRTISILVDVNPGVAATNGDYQSAAAPAGAAAAFRKQTTDDGLTEAEAIVLFGNWQPRQGGGQQPLRRGTLPPGAPHAVAVTVRADPARVDGMLGAIDLDAIAGLVR
jgi:hypothetical protein